ncbi:galectin-8 isoform X4 [Emydura macquarii macquarii]|uniref:galectin-8 isoform X4 n=1 Tax=Emydura macquarii macquarii TaxID=1129001 RepID=UPI00352A7DCA
MSLDRLQKTIHNPVIPYTGTIIGGLLPGELVVIKGSVPDDADRFQVDFQCGSSTEPRADVAFHFNPRFKRSGCIVCNTLKEGRWGSEEITYQMPFQKGKTFEIVFMVLKNKFQGEVPDGSQLVVPYITRLNSSLCPGWTVAIKGEVNTNSNSFTVNLKSSDSKDIALHLNPRMKPKVFVRNSFLYDSWGEEEKDVIDFPFSPGMFFELLIFCDVYQYKVAVNGVHILEYKHRFKQLGKINMLEITGDIQLLDVRSWQHHTDSSNLG